MDFAAKKHVNSRGFTLTELVVVLCILAILLTVSGFGLAAYSEYAAKMQAEEYARQLYLAVQSSITHAKASGQLQKLREEAEDLIIQGLLRKEQDGSILMVNHQNSESDALIVKLAADALTDAEILNGDIQIIVDLEQGLVKKVTYCMDSSIIGVYQ